jgi:hypothetical protein
MTKINKFQDILFNDQTPWWILQLYFGLTMCFIIMLNNGIR